MDFAADAVFDIAPPPTRPEARTRSAPEADGESFDAHLDAAEDLLGGPEELADTPEYKDDPTAPAQPQMQTLAQTTPPPTTSAPLVVQLIAAEAPATPATTDAKAAPTIDATAPTQQTPQAPQTAQQQATQAADAEVAPQAQTKPQASDEPQSTSPLPNNTKEAPVIREVQPSQPPVTPNVQQPATPANLARALQSLQQTVATPAVVTTPAPSPTPPTDTKNPRAIDASHPALGEAKSDAPADAKPIAATQQANAQQKSQGKDTPVAAAAKEAAAPAQTFAPDLSAPAAQTALPVTTNPAAQAQHAVATEHAATARAAPAAAQVGREIIRNFNGDSTTFELRLDPPELGRVEVKLEVSRDHRVTAVIAADSPQALSELARHARDLEQSLQDAGLQLGENGLSFDLRQGERGTQEADGSRGGRNGGDASADDTTQLAEQPRTARPVGFERWRGVRVDVMA